MNLPNKITVLRMIMVPFFVCFLLLTPTIEWFKWIAFVLFVIASITDWVDGSIARKYNLVTNFGKFMDPLADKLLVGAAMIGLTGLGIIPAWITILLISREFVISGFRLIAVEKGVVIAAGIWGKMKTVVQMIMICVLLVVMNDSYFGLSGSGFQMVITILKVVGQILIWASVILTIISLLDYLWANKAVLKDEK